MVIDRAENRYGRGVNSIKELWCILILGDVIPGGYYDNDCGKFSSTKLLLSYRSIGFCSYCLLWYDFAKHRGGWACTTQGIFIYFRDFFLRTLTTLILSLLSPSIAMTHDSNRQTVCYNSFACCRKSWWRRRTWSLIWSRTQRWGTFAGTTWTSRVR
jgi:hypothetical protein